MAFDQLFPDVARREALALTMKDGRGRPATLLFREYYCNAPRCDCRRVVLLVQWIERERIAASINFAFERPRRRDEPQMFLDPMNPQSEIAEDVFSVLARVLAENPGYRNRLEQHYTMWKRVVDDPSHPGQEKLRAVRDNTDMSSRPVRRSALKIAPNDPCPCGSGRRYEKCCRT